MAKISTLKEGQTVWLKSRPRGATTDKTLKSILIIEIDWPNKRVLAAYDGGEPQWCGPYKITSWRVNKPT